MKKNNSFIILTLFILSSCSDKPRTLISRWDNEAPGPQVLERTLASGSQGKCLKDVFNVETLKAQIKELERNYKGQKVTGQWKHLDLAALPIPQANFLRTYGQQIGDLSNPNAIDYSSCLDVPCIYNTIYGKEGHIAGYVHYYWYLKLGHMLSADNKVHKQEAPSAGVYNGKVRPLSSYLYDDKELYGLWRLALMLRPPHTNLSYLKETQRIPRGENFEGENSGACGLAWSDGSIILADGCLTIDHNPDQGYLYQAVLHELSHQVDFQQGRGSREFYRSHKQDYLALARMFIREYVDTKTQSNVREWAHQPDIKLPSDYAGTSPQENFAESLALFRVEADGVKNKLNTDHYNFISSDYYSGRLFERDPLLKSWLEQNSGETSNEVFKAVLDCSKNTTATKSNYFKANDFSSQVLPQMLNCIGEKGMLISNDLRAKTLVKDPEGCEVFSNATARSNWDVYSRDHLKKQFDSHLLELQKDKEYLAKIRDYYEQVKDKTAAREAYVSCYGEKNEEECYLTKVRDDSFAKAAGLNFSIEQTQEMSDIYVSYHSYEATKSDIQKSYQSFIGSRLAKIQNTAEKLWEGCRDIPHNDEQHPSGSHFMIADGYMISSFYNCLNVQIPSVIMDTVKSLTIDGFRVEHPKEERILAAEVGPQILKSLKDYYETEREAELNKALEYISKDNGQLRRVVLANFDWVTNVMDEKHMSIDCRDEAYSLIQINPLYHMKNDLFGQFVQGKVCLNYQHSAEYQAWLVGAESTFREKFILNLQDDIEAEAIRKAQECLQRFPIDSAVNRIKFKKERDACLIDSWPQIEEKVLTKALNDPMVTKFNMTRDMLVLKLAPGRRRVQLRVMKNYF